jgi:hypothetical protein
MRRAFETSIQYKKIPAAHLSLSSMLEQEAARSRRREKQLLQKSRPSPPTFASVPHMLPGYRNPSCGRAQPPGVKKECTY